MGMELVKFFDKLHEVAGGREISAGDVDSAFQIFLGLGDFHFRLVHQGNDFLRPSAKEHPLRREAHTPATSIQEGDAHFLLQVRHLARQSGLGDMQPLRRLGNALLPGHHEEIFQYAKFHVVSL